MSAEKNNISLRVLVAPLDWGLGHATRCIPLIHELLKAGYGVWLAGSGASGRLLAREFPQLPYQEIPSHQVLYAKTRSGFFWKMFGQLPKLLRQVKKEQYWLRNFIKHQPIDVVLSDNRYGLHHPSTYNILITHQLGLRTGLFKGADRILQRIIDRRLKKFNVCWVPDHAENPTLSGKLGHPERTIPIPIQYVGPLTRFNPTDRTIIPRKLTIVLSGPEPQRTLLENKCLKELKNWNGTVCLIRGLPDRAISIQAPKSWHVFDHLPSDRLQQEIEEAEQVVARCGYSTLMDLSSLKKKAVLIPTPGQAEQEYLASWMNEQGAAHCIDQKENVLNALLKETANSILSDFPNRQTNKTSELIRSLQLMRSSHP